MDLRKKKAVRLVLTWTQALKLRTRLRQSTSEPYPITSLFPILKKLERAMR